MGSMATLTVQGQPHGSDCYPNVPACEAYTNGIYKGYPKGPNISQGVKRLILCNIPAAIGRSSMESLNWRSQTDLKPKAEVQFVS